MAEAGWDPTYGARPLKRALQRLVENPLAVRLLEGEFTDGETILVDAREGEIVFEKAVAAETSCSLTAWGPTMSRYGSPYASAR